MSGFLKEFREFAVKGNVMDMAVGIIIGAAFGKIVSSMVNDLLMPVIGLVTGGVDFTNYFVVLGEGSYETLDAAREAGAAVLAWGGFVQTVVDFLIVAMAVFVMVRWVNRVRRMAEEGETPEAAPEVPAPPEDVVLLRQIRDALVERST